MRKNQYYRHKASDFYYEDGSIDENNLRELTESIYWDKRAPQVIKERGLEKSIKKQRKRTVYTIRYKHFYSESEKLSLDLRKDICEKKTLLKKYFSRFEDDGKTPIQNMTNLNVGVIFCRMHNYSKNRIKE